MTETPPTDVLPRWSLADLFPSIDSPALQNAFEELETRVAAFETTRALLKPDISHQQFMEIIRQQEQIDHLGRRVGSYASLAFSEDTQDQAALTIMARVQQLSAELSNRMLFFSLWWKDLSDADAQRLMADSGDYRYWLEEMRHFKPYTLSEAEEKIINIKDVTGAGALQTLYDSITNRYSFKIEMDGKIQEMTRGELSSLFRSPDPDLRAKSYQELYRVYGADGSILGQMYQTLARDWGNEQIKLRGYATPISARNLANDIPDEVVDTLLEVSKKNAVLFQRFFRLKARWLGMDKLRRYDIYAPIHEAEKSYTFAQAKNLVLESFHAFHPQLSELAGRVFAENHIDAQMRKGKRSGAFCATAAPDITPWVLLNYTGKSEEVYTMAHELGHAIHSMLAAHHNVFTFHASLPLAETASTFGEILLLDRILAEETDEAVRRDQLFKQVDGAYATILRQAYFALFERQAHELIAAGASVDDLADAYLKNLAEQFGSAVDVSDEFRWEWVSIPHIYQVPFYVYAYSFGQLLVFALYQQYRQEGEAFKPRYLKILSTGGSEAPVKVLADAGIDIYSAAFWQGGFDVIAEMIQSLEAAPLPNA